MDSENNSHSDKIIVANILNGNVQDFSVVVRNTEKLITQIVRKMTDNEEDQKDLVQDIYLKAYQHLPTFQFKSRLSTWIANIAYNTTVNHLQKKKIPIIGIEQTIGNQLMASDNPDRETTQTESTQMLHAAIAKLSPLHQTLIALYHLEELPIKEISEITNLPNGTIKSHLFRARKILKDHLNGPNKND